MTENTNGGTTHLNNGGQVGEQQILLNLDPYEEFRIQFYDIDGKETIVPNLGAEENFARIIQNKFDFTPTYYQRQLESIRFDDSQQLPPPTIRNVPEPEWEKTVNKLRQTIYEVQFIHEISKMMKESSDEQLIETVNAHRTFNEDLRTKEKAGELFPSRIEQLIYTHGILKSGSEQLRKRSDMTGDFYQAIFKLQKKWKVKQFGNNNFFVDLAYNFPSIKLYETILVKIIRKREAKKIDLIIPAIATYGRRSMLTSVILKHYPETLKNIDDILEKAQQSVFYLELFDVLVACMSRPTNREFTVVELTDLEIKLQINQNVILAVTLSESSSSPFWEIQTKLLNAPTGASTLLNSESMDVLLQDCLLQVHDMVKDNTLTLEKAFIHFENVLKYLRHKLMCLRFENTLQECSELFSTLNISPSFFRYPDETIYHITTLSSTFNIHFKQRDILLNSKRFSSVKEMQHQQQHMIAPSASNLSFGTLESPDMNLFYAQQQQQSLFFDHQQQQQQQQQLNQNNTNSFPSPHMINNSWLTTLIGNRNGDSSHTTSPTTTNNILSADSNNYQSQHTIDFSSSNHHFIPITNNHSLKAVDSPSPSPSVLESELNRYSNNIPSSFSASPSGRSSMIDSLGPPQKTKCDSKCASETILDLYANVNLNQCESNVLKVKLKVESTYASDCKQWPVVSETVIIKTSQIFKMEEPLMYHYKFHHLQKLCISISNENNEIIGESFLLSNDLITTSIKKNVYDENRINTVGSAIVTIEESSVYNNLVSLQFSARNLDGKGYIQDTSDPYLVVSKQNVEGFYEKIIVTEYKHTKNPTWKQKKIASFELSNTNFDTPLKIEVFDWNM